MPNLFILMEKQRPLMQFDANCGIPAAVLEMLVFSEPGMIKLLPAVPKSWPAGNAEGIRCRGGVEVSLKWNMNEKWIDAAFISRTAQKVTVKFPAPVASIKQVHRLGGTFKRSLDVEIDRKDHGQPRTVDRATRQKQWKNKGEKIDSAEAKIAASPYGDAYRLVTLPAGKRVAMTLTFK